MNRSHRLIAGFSLLLGLALSCGLARATDEAAGNMLDKIYLQAKPSLVAVKYNYVSELGSQELTAAGVVISDDGLVMIPLAAVTPLVIPDDQMKDFKIVIPSDTGDDTEIDATLEGRDQRSNLAFVRAAPEAATSRPAQKWTAVKFLDVPPQIGDALYSVGILPKNSGYKAHATAMLMSLRLRGPVPQMLVDGNLAGTGAVVFNAQGQAIGYTFPSTINDSFLDNPRNVDDIPQITDPPKLFVPASDFLPSLENPPKAGKRLELPWLGCEMKGLEKDDADYFGLTNVPAVQIGDVVAGFSAAKAGLKTLDVVTKINSQPIERGDMPRELEEIVSRKIQWMHVGDKVTFTVIHNKGDAPKDVAITLTAQPMQEFEAHRFYAKDLGFVARDVVFRDTYVRKLPITTTGVAIALLRPQAAAQAAKLQRQDLVTQMNGKPITSLEQFKKDYLQFRKERASDPVVLEVSRPDGKQETINIEPPQTDAQPGGGM